jgi:hypothetical protein
LAWQDGPGWLVPFFVLPISDKSQGGMLTTSN